MAHSRINSFKAADLIIQLSSTPKMKPDVVDFGTVFTDHMLTVEWNAIEGWQTPLIRPFGNLSLHPACSSLHYGIQLFEGLMVYRGDDNRLRLFRPLMNMSRMAKSANRACLPAFDESELLECIRRLVEIDQDWVPCSESSSLYIRPTLIGTEPSLGVKKPTRALLYVILCQAGSYFNTEGKALSLWADPKYTRAWKGGTGDCKMGGNYGGTLFAQYEAGSHGCEQVLWLYGEDHQITEAGTMNIFLHWINEDGEEELATPPLDGIILPGVTRQSILELTKKWDEFKVLERYLTMKQLCSALKQQRLKEMFGSGTACRICPVGNIMYQGKILQLPCLEKSSLSSRIAAELADIQGLGGAGALWQSLGERR
ncbi:PREDICTED: branched-chain-amino-acid aminotransferase, cytosolic-like [Cyprinodon variegatus]|uniref:branched-chain-amino-acid aminotransferase, cytosolic-like n=1 Tax=Cyprinodon variegatus TaxID=28743 RepID=UPI00074296A9|nr:PREDICTED: branched-chain-amino-acid aminotransferase, cytosolic-like [Cyprinodon variegatus]